MSIRICGDNTTASPAITSASDTDTGLQFGTNEVKVVNGNLDITDGNLKVAAGHGIDFSANANDTSMTSELLDEYEEGLITNWRLIKTDASSPYSGSNNGETHIKYTKIGRCVYISGHIRTDSTTSGLTGNLKIVNAGDGVTPATLPFVPNHRGGLPIVHTRSCNTSHTTFGLSVGFKESTATVWVYANNLLGDYILDHNTLATVNQTILVITFNGHYFTDD